MTASHSTGSLFEVSTVASGRLGLAGRRHYLGTGGLEGDFRDAAVLPQRWLALEGAISPLGTSRGLRRRTQLGLDL